MTTESIIRFFSRRPFVGFDMYLADGRVFRVAHPEMAMVEEYATSVSSVDDDGRLEVFDTALIVSCRTHQSAFDA